jgi:hypothetical protein
MTNFNCRPTEDHILCLTAEGNYEFDPTNCFGAYHTEFSQTCSIDLPVSASSSAFPPELLPGTQYFSISVLLFLGIIFGLLLLKK